MREPGYQYVLGRPLLYLGFIDDKRLERIGGIDGLRRSLDDFHASLSTHGVPRPYLVIMDFYPPSGRKWAAELNGDAISSYATPPRGVVPYNRLVGHTEHFWEKSRETGVHVVPIIMTGWDPRPRVERPMPWGNPYGTHNGEVNRSEPGTPAEIAGHLAHAIGWLSDHADAAPAQTAIVYAWNEFDEGGWLAPTLKEGTARLDAVARTLRPATASKPATASQPKQAVNP